MEVRKDILILKNGKFAGMDTIRAETLKNMACNNITGPITYTINQWFGYVPTHYLPTQYKIFILVFNGGDRVCVGN